MWQTPSILFTPRDLQLFYVLTTDFGILRLESLMREKLTFFSLTFYNLFSMSCLNILEILNSSVRNTRHIECLWTPNMVMIAFYA